jgi:hypothetical protein
MPCGVWTIKDVPANQLDNVVGNFNLDAPIKVEKTKQADGNWTVTATFAPCPPGTVGEHSSSFSSSSASSSSS